MYIKIGFLFSQCDNNFPIHLRYNANFFVFKAIKDKKQRQRGLNVRRKLTAAERLELARKKDREGINYNDEDILEEDGKFEKLYA